MRMVGIDQKNCFTSLKWVGTVEKLNNDGEVMTDPVTGLVKYKVQVLAVPRDGDGTSELITVTIPGVGGAIPGGALAAVAEVELPGLRAGAYANSKTGNAALYFQADDVIATKRPASGTAASPSTTSASAAAQGAAA
jgi:hypothetical protein